MAPYFITFGLSTICCAFGEYFIHRKKERTAQVFFLLAVLIAAILAGVRDLSIGTDIWTYGEWSFRAARKNDNLFSYIQSQTDLELLYNILVWVVARFTSDSHWLYFITGFITYYFVMKGIHNYKKQISITIGWMTFLFLYYGDTFNTMRQFLSVAIAFWGLKFALNGKFKKYIAVTIVAILFHNTALLSFLGVAIVFFLKKKDTLFRKIAVVASAVIVAIIYSNILEILIKMGIISDRFARYYSNTFVLSLNPILLRLPFLVIIAVWYQKYRFGERKYIKKWESNIEADIIIMFLIIDILTSAMRGTLSTLYRVAFLFGIYRTIAYSRICVVLRKNNRLLVTALLLVYLLVLWIYQNVLQGNNEIYPFTSEILGIY